MKRGFKAVEFIGAGELSALVDNVAVVHRLVLDRSGPCRLATIRAYYPEPK